MPKLDNSRRFHRAAIFVASCGATLFLSGCAERKVHAFPWATAVLVRPNVPVAHPNGDANAVDLAPDFRVEAPANAGKIFAARPVPPRPRVSAPATADPIASPKSTGLVPELSPQETAVAKEQVGESIALAEKNAAIARGKKLTPAQSDVLSKIAGFLAEAREAGGEGDWARARNLAKKAQILSEDLVASL